MAEVINQLSSDDLAKSIYKFEKYLTSIGKATSTVAKTTNEIKKALLNIGEWSKKDLEAYIASLVEAGKRVVYVNSIIYSIRIFSRYLLEQGVNLHEGLVTFPDIKQTKLVIRRGAFTWDEVQKFLAYFPRKNEDRKLTAKWNSFFTIIVYTGLNPGEVANLTVGSVNMSNLTIHTDSNHTLRERVLPFPEIISPVFRFVMNGVPQTGYLFPRRDNKNKPERAVNWHYQFHKRLNKMGFLEEDMQERRLTVASLRNSYIEMCLQRGLDPLGIKTIVGHGDIRSTLLYNSKPRRVANIDKRIRGILNRV